MVSMKLSFSVLLVCTSLVLVLSESTQNEASADPIYSVTVQTGSVVHEVDPNYRSVTIDTTNNRQFFDVNWSDPNLMSYMKALGPMIVRIGGSGEGQDGLVFDGTKCTRQYSCIDEERFDRIYNIVVANGGSKMVWGLSYPKNADNTFDNRTASALMAYASGKGYTIFGFELGNEDYPQIDNYPAIYAADFGRLKSMIAHYWPNPANQPVLIGPDNIEGANWHTQVLLQEFIKQKIPMHAITSHEYYGENNAAYLNGQRLDSGISTSTNWTGTLAQYYGPIGHPGVSTIQMWAGEIGPSIGGSGNCTASAYHRFNIFADGFWYLDSLATHALYGYSVFCRQDFYGIDYALIHCQGHYPVPDFYLALAWNKVVGTKVLNATRPVTNPKGSVRPYAHCSKEHVGGLVVMLINVFGNEVQVQLTNPVGTSREDYLFTALHPNGSYPDGIYGYWAALNGKLVNVTSTGALPANVITPNVRSGSGLNVITLPAYSYGYFVYPQTNLAVCGGTGTPPASFVEEKSAPAQPEPYSKTRQRLVARLQTED